MSCWEGAPDAPLQLPAACNRTVAAAVRLRRVTTCGKPSFPSVFLVFVPSLVWQPYVFNLETGANRGGFSRTVTSHFAVL